jgi:hypothetical protein
MIARFLHTDAAQRVFSSYSNANVQLCSFTMSSYAHTTHIQQDLDVTEFQSITDVTNNTAARHPITLFGENSCMNMLSQNLTQCKKLKTLEITLCRYKLYEHGPPGSFKFLKFSSMTSSC